MAQQGDWRFCDKCFAMFFAGGSDLAGRCPTGGAHHAQGFVFDLPFDVPETPNAQGAWRFCDRCSTMFYDGNPDHKGVCPASGAHHAQGFVFVLPHDIPGPGQSSWRFCDKCFAMFFAGDSDLAGRCPTGGAHHAQGFVFVLPFHLEDVKTFDSGPLTSSLPLGGSVHLVLRNNGDFTFSSHAHDSGFDSIHYAISAVLMTPSGIAFTFQHQGHVEGTSAGLPFGTPNRNDNFVTSGNNPMITSEFGGMDGAKLVARISGADALVGGLTGMLDDLLKQVSQELEKAAAAAIVNLVA